MSTMTYFAIRDAGYFSKIAKYSLCNKRTRLLNRTQQRHVSEREIWILI